MVFIAVAYYDSETNSVDIALRRSAELFDQPINLTFPCNEASKLTAILDVIEKGGEMEITIGDVLLTAISSGWIILTSGADDTMIDGKDAYEALREVADFMRANARSH